MIYTASLLCSSISMFLNEISVAKIGCECGKLIKTDNVFIFAFTISRKCSTANVNKFYSFYFPYFFHQAAHFFPYSIQLSLMSRWIQPSARISRFHFRLTISLRNFFSLHQNLTSIILEKNKARKEYKRSKIVKRKDSKQISAIL